MGFSLANLNQETATEDKVATVIFKAEQD